MNAPGVESRPSPIAGLGLFALRSFAPGERVAPYTGTTTTAPPDPGRPGAPTYTLEIAPGLWLDGAADSNPVVPLSRSEEITVAVKSADPINRADPLGPAELPDPEDPAGACCALAGTDPDVVGAGSCTGNESVPTGMWISNSLDSSLKSLIVCQMLVQCD